MKHFWKCQWNGSFPYNILIGRGVPLPIITCWRHSSQCKTKKLNKSYNLHVDNNLLPVIYFKISAKVKKLVTFSFTVHFTKLLTNGFQSSFEISEVCYRLGNFIRIHSCQSNCELWIKVVNFYAKLISGWFRQFYFLQKTRMTKMKNALKSRSLFVFYTQKKKKDTFF